MQLPLKEARARNVPAVSENHEIPDSKTLSQTTIIKMTWTDLVEQTPTKKWDIQNKKSKPLEITKSLQKYLNSQVRNTI